MLTSFNKYTIKIYENKLPKTNKTRQAIKIDAIFKKFIFFFKFTSKVNCEYNFLFSYFILMKISTHNKASIYTNINYACNNKSIN